MLTKKKEKKHSCKECILAFKWPLLLVHWCMHLAFDLLARKKKCSVTFDRVSITLSFFFFIDIMTGSPAEDCCIIQGCHKAVLVMWKSSGLTVIVWKKLILCCCWVFFVCVCVCVKTSAEEMFPLYLCWMCLCTDEFIGKVSKHLQKRNVKYTALYTAETSEEVICLLRVVLVDVPVA